MDLLQKLIDILDMGLQGLKSALQVTLIGTNEVSSLRALLSDSLTFSKLWYFFLKVFSLTQSLYKCMFGSTDDKMSILASHQGIWSSFACM